MASDVLAGTSFDPAFSYGYTDPVYFGYSPKYPCSTLEEGKALSLEQLDENIADLQAKYLDYLKSCQSEELKDQAQNLYAQKLEWFRYVKTVKTRTPDQEQELHETAFYHMYDEIVSNCETWKRAGGLRNMHGKSWMSPIGQRSIMKTGQSRLRRLVRPSNLQVQRCLTTRPSVCLIKPSSARESTV